MNYNLQELSFESEKKLKTLNKDIYLEKKPNGSWDIDFIQGDLHKSEYLESLQNGIIIACLTSWNYLNRYGNPTYANFGNRAYLQLKQNKSEINKYKIKTFFEECLNNMRRVLSVSNVVVTEDTVNPYKYNVWFEVVSISDELVTGEFTITNDLEKQNSYIKILNGLPFEYDGDTIKFTLGLYSINGYGLEDELIHYFINGNHKGVTKDTDDRGLVSITFKVNDLNISDTISFEFHGSDYINGCVTGEKNIFYNYEV